MKAVQKIGSSFMTANNLFLSALALLAATSLCASAAAKPKQWLDPDRRDSDGTKYQTFKSELAKSEVSYMVYLPPDYASNTSRRYPVVYWLHGFGGNQRSGFCFVKALDSAIHSGASPAMICILVNGLSASFYCDSVEGKWPVDSVIAKELVPHVDKTYRTIAKRETRAVEGFSMGGYGAAHLGFKHPELFGVVSSFSGALTDSAEWGPLPETQENGRRKTMLQLKTTNPEYFAATDLASVIRHHADAIRGKTKIRLKAGDKDEFLFHRNEKALHEFLLSLKIENELEIVPGVNHDQTLMYKTLGDRAFAWYKTAFAK